MKPIVIDKECACIRGCKLRNIKKGRTYKVYDLYQLNDGDFMVAVVNDIGISVQVKANRFNISMP